MLKSLLLALFGTTIAIALVACGAPDSNAGRTNDGIPIYNLSSGYSSSYPAAPC